MRATHAWRKWRVVADITRAPDVCAARNRAIHCVGAPVRMSVACDTLFS